jgi:hypothetical protein
MDVDSSPIAPSYPATANDHHPPGIIFRLGIFVGKQ